MNEQRLFRRRHLPHVDVEDKPYFITACLHGSLPAAGLENLRRYRNELDHRPKPHNMSVADWELTKHKLVFKFFDDLLDGKSPVTHLSNDRCAKIVEDAFLHFSDSRYKLIAYVVMPSHHHWLFLPNATWCEELFKSQISKLKKQTPRESISHSIQSYTATQCNRVLHRSGPFWQQETFDHYIRDDEELYRVIAYIENNPVKAGLVSRPEDWSWSSASYRKKYNIPIGQPIQPVG
jgi:REP element-mobilizing transposase RayT